MGKCEQNTFLKKDFTLQVRISPQRMATTMTSPKPRFFKTFKNRFFLRFHMSLILLATGLSGLLGTKLLMWGGVENVLIRYPLNVVIAYLCFFLFVKLWLWYITPNRDSVDPTDALDVIDPFGGSAHSSTNPRN